MLLDIDWQGARQIKARRPDTPGVFILPPSAAELERRLHGRGQDDPKVIAARMDAAHAEMTHYAEYDYLIVNDTFDHALEDLQSLLLARRLGLAGQRRRYAGLIRELGL